MGKGIVDIVVQEEDIDVLNHMNNLVYIKHLENARIKWYEQMGFDLPKMLDKGYGTVLRNLNISYLKEAVLGEKLRITTIPMKVRNTSMMMKQWIENEQGEHITEAESVIVLIDLHKRSKTQIPADMADQIKQFIAEETE